MIELRAPFDPPCTIEDLPEEDYFAMPAVSRSRLYTALTKSPAHAKVQKRETAAMSLGTLAHRMLQQPDMPIYVKPTICGRGSNAGKVAYVGWICQTIGVEHPPMPSGKISEGKIYDHWLDILEPQLNAWKGGLVATMDQYEAACRMRDAVIAHPLAGAIYDSGRAEVTMIAQDPETGLLMKIRLDWLPDGHAVLVDYKTAAEVWVDVIESHASRFGYHFQAAVYRHVYRLVTGEMAPWVNVYAESQAPWSVLVVPMDPDAIERGALAMRHALKIWALCEEHQFWPGPGWDWDQMQYGLVQLGVRGWAA